MKSPAPECYAFHVKADGRTGKQKTGALGEQIAETFLIRKGYKVIDRNYRKPWGEIDIIAEKGNTVRFVEVKTVTRERYPEFIPEEMVDQRKLEKLSRTANLYMDAKGDRRQFQIDVVGVILDTVSRQAQCRLIEQAL